MLNAASAGDRTESWLRLTENRCLSRGKTHVACQYELIAACAHATLDLSDADKTTRAEMTKHEGDRSFACQLRRLLAVFFDPGHVDVRDEIVRVGTLQHKHFDGVVGLGLLNEGHQIANQFWAQKIHGRGCDVRKQNTPLLPHSQRLLTSITYFKLPHA